MNANRKRNVSPARSEDSDCSVSMTDLSGQNSPIVRRQPPACPEAPIFGPYNAASPQVYAEALEKYTQEMVKYKLDLERYNEEELRLIRLARNSDPGSCPLVLSDPEFKPGHYAGGVDFSHNSNSNRHNVTIDSEGRIHVYSRSNISTFNKNNRYYSIEVGPFSFKMSLTQIKHTWGYAIELDTKEFKPFVQTQLDSKERVRILISAAFESGDLQIEELCFNFLNLRNPIQLEDMWIQHELYDVKVNIITPF